MQAEYPKKQPTRTWDHVHVEYPLRKYPETEVSSTTVAHDYWPSPEVIKPYSKHDPIDKIKDYYYDYNIERDLMRSLSTLDFRSKYPEVKRHIKHNPCTENSYIYPPSRRLADRPPQCRVHGTTEMRDKYTLPETPARLCTEKAQLLHRMSWPVDPPEIENDFRKDIEPLDTTHEGFEKHLDPYLTTSRLHHRPFTADQLSRESNSSARNIITNYTFADTPMTRTPKTKPEKWWFCQPRHKSVFDRDRFKEEFRETHNRPKWVPGTFRTEVRDNFTSFIAKPEYKIHKFEEDVQSDYKKRLAKLVTNAEEEQAALLQGYKTENSTVGSRKPICAVLNQYPEINKKLQARENKNMHKL